MIYSSLFDIPKDLESTAAGLNTFTLKIRNLTYIVSDQDFDTLEVGDWILYDDTQVQIATRIDRIRLYYSMHSAPKPSYSVSRGIPNNPNLPLIKMKIIYTDDESILKWSPKLNINKIKHVH